MRCYIQICGLLLLCCLSLFLKLGMLNAASIGQHVDHAGCVRVTIIKGPTTTTTTTTTTTARPPVTNATVAPG
ncbi:uncharacterized protein LOC117793434 [Drosophila innubila]|uniref:uncharacterized protein LOC117793434 n=1 Tax=Drosophila innubila TaxID=198719 RepID=UPI00148D7ABB|nr:uncharacterized protein LOC117793434 [Drosophila innubila]